MKLRAGSFLDSSAALNGTDFGGASIFLVEYDSNGAVGVVFNRLFGRTLSELHEFRNSKPLPLYYGGPVDTGNLFFLHRRPDLIEGGRLVSGSIHWGGDFQQAVRCLSNKQITGTDVRVFVGYCGWDAGELEAEIEEGSWVLRDGKAGELFAES